MSQLVLVWEGRVTLAEVPPLWQEAAELWSRHALVGSEQEPLLSPARAAPGSSRQPLRDVFFLVLAGTGFQPTQQRGFPRKLLQGKCRV